MKRILVMLWAAALVVNANAQEVSATYDPDVNGDNNIGVPDLLALLSLFSENDLDDDGIWDSQDDCVGEYDECGVCNGEGIPEGYCTCTLMIDALGECGGDCADDSDGDGVCDEYFGPCLGLETVTFDGYTYDLVAIGEQCWFSENLRSHHYANGDSIPANLSDGEWSSTTEGAVAVYGEDAGCSNSSPDGDACDPTWSLNEYGRLYNWYAVDDARGLCPTGWHVPTDGEWTVITDYLGGSSVAGAEMKTTYGWDGGGNGTNSSGFSSLPGGLRLTGGYFSSAGANGDWWSSSPIGSYAWYRKLSYLDPGVGGSSSGRRNGYSVRCLKDD